MVMKMFMGMLVRMPMIAVSMIMLVSMLMNWSRNFFVFQIRQLAQDRFIHDRHLYAKFDIAFLDAHTGLVDHDLIRGRDRQ
jgi:uncharacterized membrane protein